VAIALLLAAGPAAPHTAAPLAPMGPIAASDRVLVIAPHPDDETLCCAGLLQQAAALGATVGVVWITAGDSFEFDAVVTERTWHPKGTGLEHLGLRRIGEAHAAADRLGVPRSQQFMLGFPDRDIGLLLRRPPLEPLRSRYTGVNAVPYAEALHPGSPYDASGLRSNLREVLERFQPTIVLAAAPQDRHPDHSASGALAVELLRTEHPGVRVYYWIVHAGVKWPAPRGLHPGRALLPPARAANLHWQALPLDANQVEGKLAALREHRTQLKLMRRFLYSFVRANELYAPVP
jgi:LmbE family N-acetylglucosaminyl deacetylase